MKSVLDDRHVNSAAETGGAALGDLPQWRLEDLYDGMDSPALRADMDRIASEAAGFETQWKGKLAQAAADKRLGAIIADYEALEDLQGRIASYAGLLFAADTSDPARAKFYGDVQQHLTGTSAHLLFFGLEINRIDEAVLEEAYKNDAALARYRPWIDDLRLEKPYQLDDKVEQVMRQLAAGEARIVFDLELESASIVSTRT